jgi:type IX secretion system PorP/SprF family membrane protein
MRKTFFILLIFLGLQHTVTTAQDIQLTQFYAAPIYLNPAFAGANADSRLATTYRNQWAALPGAFNSFLLSYDYYLSNFRSGVGIMLTSDKAGSAGLGNNTVGLNYAYDYKFTRVWSASIGVRATYGYRSLDFNRLVFGDQISRAASTSIQTPTPDKINYMDFATGALLFSKTQWVGITLNHINRPNESFLSKSAPLPIKGSVHGGYNFPLNGQSGEGRKNEKPSITVAFQYRFQKEFDQADLGVYYKRPYVFIGVWYRGIPGFKAYKKGYSNHDAVAIMVGGIYKDLIIGYSYDITISKLTMVSGGSHEISLNYQFINPKKPKHHRTKIIPCPKF